jgi:hypothetical protein
MTQTSGTLTTRMMGAAMLSVDTFEEVEADQTATAQAATVVVMVALCQAIGSWTLGPFAAGWAAVVAFGSWLIWAGITYVVGEKLFDGKATWGELLRTLGFAQAPGVLFLFGIIPLFGWAATLFVSLWIMVAGFIAIRQALDIGNLQTFLTVLIGGGVYAVLQNLPFFPF